MYLKRIYQSDQLTDLSLAGLISEKKVRALARNKATRPAVIGIRQGPKIRQGQKVTHLQTSARIEKGGRTCC